MPLYEYRCQDCSKTFEVLVRGDERAQCPSCEGKSLEKLFSVFAVSAPGSESAPQKVAGPCGSCGDPRGPGACALN